MTKHIRGLRVLLLAVCIVVPSQMASARHDDDRDHDRGHDRDRDRDRERHQRYGDRCFRDEHLRVIRGYYREHDVPPGLERRYYRTGELPRGWERRVRPFPVEVERSLPPVPDGCSRGYVDGYAVVFQPRTHLLIDVHAVFGN